MLRPQDTLTTPPSLGTTFEGAVIAFALLSAFGFWIGLLWVWWRPSC